jgi:Jacalin-like lectin domain
MLPIGPFGDAGTCNSNEFSDENVLATERIAMITVCHGKLVDGVRVTYRDENGRTSQSPWHGGDGSTGGGFSDVVLDVEHGEYITGVDVRSGKTVDGIRFRTSAGRSFPNPTSYYGNDASGGPHTMNIPEGNELVGFFGKYGKNEDEDDRIMVGQIGVYHRPRQA